MFQRQADLELQLGDFVVLVRGELAARGAGLRLSWTHNSLKSEGMEQFIEEHLPAIR